MSNEELYSAVPPTKLRNIDEKFRPADTSNFWFWVADNVFFRMLENRFFSLKYKGIENYSKINPDAPLVVFAPHCNWWDGIVGYNMCQRVLKDREFRIMVEELNRFPILRHCGCFSINKKSAQASMTALKYAIDEIGDTNKMLYIFPQGIIMPPNYRPINLQTGLAYIAQKAIDKFGAVNLLPFAVNYMFLRADRPEVFVDINEPIVLTGKNDRKELTHKLETALTMACDKQFHDLSTGNLEGYETLFQQKLKWYKKIEKRLKKIEIKGSGV